MRAFQNSIQELCELVPDHLPKPVLELASGSMGTCYLTDDPEWVLKVTNSTEEVRGHATMLKFLPDMVCDVLATVRIKDSYISLIWKEKCITDHSWSHAEHTALRESAGDIGVVDVHGANVGIDRKGKLVVFDPFMY